MEKKIYTIATAHLDTVWNWDFEHVINVCLKETLDQNFNHFNNYPDYRFNFEGSYRYELFEEYYPKKFEQLREYINEGSGTLPVVRMKTVMLTYPHPKAFSEIFFTVTSILKRNSARRVTISSFLTASASVMLFRQL